MSPARRLSGRLVGLGERMSRFSAHARSAPFVPSAPASDHGRTSVRPFVPAATCNNARQVRVCGGARSDRASGQECRRSELITAPRPRRRCTARDAGGRADRSAGSRSRCPSRGCRRPGASVSVSPPLSPSVPSFGSAIARSGRAQRAARPLEVAAAVGARGVAARGVHRGVVRDDRVHEREARRRRSPPATWPAAVEWLFAIVQFLIVPVGVWPSQTPPPLLPVAVFSAIVTLVICTVQVLIQMPPL